MSIKHNKLKKYNRAVICAVCILAIVLTVVFIFRNSMANSQESHAQSDRFVDLLRPIIDPHGKMTYEQVSSIVRKAAHFAEFAALGSEIAVLCFALSFGFKLRDAIYAAAGALLIANIDEYLQIYSARGSSVSDVFIDLGGAITGIAVGYGVALLCRYIRKKIAERKKTVPENIT